MVRRSDLLAAQGELKARNEDLQAKEKDLAWLQEQLHRAQEQVNAARVESAQLRAEMGGMVLRSELDAVRAALAEREGAGKSDSQAHAKAVGELNGRIGALEKEKAELLLKMQVGFRTARVHLMTSYSHDGIASLSGRRWWLAGLRFVVRSAEGAACARPVEIETDAPHSLCDAHRFPHRVGRHYPPHSAYLHGALCLRNRHYTPCASARSDQSRRRVGAGHGRPRAAPPGPVSARDARVAVWPRGAVLCVLKDAPSPHAPLLYAQAWRALPRLETPRPIPTCTSTALPTPPPCVWAGARCCHPLQLLS
jgi:hypothetical protein